MAGQIGALRRQLRSIQSTQKITNAMSLVSTAKLQKIKDKTAENMVYSQTYQEMLLTAMSSNEADFENNVYFKQKDFDLPLHIVISSNSGLCGSYNVDLTKYLEAHITKDEPIFVLGNYGIKWLYDNDYCVIKSYENVENVSSKIFSELVYDVLKLFLNNEISSVDIIYTQYINTLNFSPSTYHLLPLKLNDQLEKKDIELVPSGDELLETLMPLYISSLIYDTFLQAKTSEHAARRNAMDGANKNAEELIDEVSLHINQARQAAITQEMNEITAGADAL